MAKDHVAMHVDLRMVEVTAEIAGTDSPRERPFLQVKVKDIAGNKVTLNLSAKAAQMIGGAAVGMHTLRRPQR